MPMYRLLLRLYPASFRKEYGSEMLALFARRQREAATAGAAAALWIEAITDTIANATRAHLDILEQDLRYAVRTLARTPGFTAAAVLVAALGIGATTATFSLADHVLVRPLPFPQADRLVKLYHDQSFRGYSRMELSPASYEDWKRQSTSFEQMAAYHDMSAVLVGQSEPVRLDGVGATPDLFQTLGVQAALGRVFTSADARADAPLALVLSDEVWTTVFEGDPNVLGRTVTLDDEGYVIVGVMPREFRFPSRTTGFWAVRRWAPVDLEDRGDFYIYGIGRLKRGVSIAQARAELNTIAAEIASRYPRDLARTGASVIRLRDEIRPQARLMLLALVGAAVCMLLIACSNLASLLLTRALIRQRELAIRAAIGAGWERLVRQTATESLLLAALGGIGGVLLAVVTTPLVARLVPTALPIGDAPGVDGRLLAVASILTLLTGLGFGMLPAVRLSRATGFEALKEGGRSGLGARTDRFRAALVIAEVTASIVLLVSAGLLIRALWHVQSIDPGFRTDGLLAVRTWLPMPQYEKLEPREHLYRRVLDEVRALPGVKNAAYISFLPMVMRGGIWQVEFPGRPTPLGEAHMASIRFVTPGFFDTMRIPIKGGRDVSDMDSGNAAHVAVVSESFAREHWPGRDALGQHFSVRQDDRIVVGVVGDIRVRGLERESEPQVYLPSGQISDRVSIGFAPKELVIKAETPLAILAPAVRDIVRRVDPNVPISSIQAFSDIVDGETSPRRVQLAVLGAFTAVAVLLAAVGIHGLLTFTVSTRTRELGIRLALGADSRRLLARVLGYALVLGAVGIGIGLPVAIGAARVMQSLLAGVSPTDPFTIGAAAAVCLLMTLTGGLAPALRVLRIDPVTAIRDE